MANEQDVADPLSAGYPASAQPSRPTPFAPPAQNRPLQQEELDQRVGETQHRLAELKRAQEQLERERVALEDARRRRSELRAGREEMITNLARGITLLEEAEFTARHDLEQMGRTLTDFRDALNKAQSIHEEHWTEENWNVELTRALTIIENARMEWNAARLKWPVLSGNALTPAVASPVERAVPPAPALANLSTWQLCRMGLALTWPLAIVGLIALGMLAFFLSRK